MNTDKKREAGQFNFVELVLRILSTLQKIQNQV